MLVLVLDTSSAATIVAIASVDATTATITATRTHVDARAHGEVLVPTVAACLGDAATTIGQLGAIVAGVGPGPFTGLRIGLVTAAAFGDALQIPTYGVCSLDGIGLAIDTPALLVAGDARRREIYWAAYRAGRRVDGPQVAAPGDVAVDGFSASAGAGARLYADQLGLPLLDQDYPDPLALVTAALDRVRSNGPSERLVPLYLRRPDAVEPGVPKSVLT